MAEQAYQMDQLQLTVLIQHFQLSHQQAVVQVVSLQVLAQVPNQVTMVALLVVAVVAHQEDPVVQEILHQFLHHKVMLVDKEVHLIKL